MNRSESTDQGTSLLDRLATHRTAYIAAVRSGERPSLERFLAEFAPAERELALHELLFAEFSVKLPTEIRMAKVRQEYAEHEQAIMHALRRAQTVEEAATMSWDTKSIAEHDHGTASSEKPRAADQHEETVTQHPAQSSQLAAAGVAELETIGDYEILSELGRGGMGVVYQARQTSANRMVALKVIRSDRLFGFDEETRREVIDRFRSEAQAAAVLDHDNIVTVYEVNSCDGQPFYSMRFVDGESLSETLKDGPLNGVLAARYMQGVCRAIWSAHQQKILHRDLKPSNVIIDRRTDRALVADFGLAKLMTTEQSATQTGAIIGTPPYMAPEQTRDASRVTEAADIYGIGATLYHLLTGRPPFQTPSIVETIRQVNTDEPVAPRRLNPAVHVDLETICMKCLEKEPKRRYETAHEVELELTRFLSGDPIAASPIGRVQRLVRWSQRHPATAALSTLALVLLVLLIVSLGVGYLQVSNALSRETIAKDEAAEQALIAEENLRTAFEAADTALTRIATNPELQRYGLEELRLQLLQDVVPFLEGFAEKAPQDDSFRFAQAVALRHLGNVQAEVGQLGLSESTLEDSRRKLNVQRESQPSPDTDLHYASACIDLARVKVQQGDFDAAYQLHQEALGIYEALLENGDTRQEVVLGLASLHLNLASAEGLFRRRPNEIRNHFERALELRRSFRKSHPSHVENELGYVNSLINYANFLQSGSDFDRADSLYQSASEVLSQQEKLLTGHHDYLRTRSILSYEQGVLAYSQEFLENAEKHLVASIADAESMVRLHPIVPDDRRRLVTTRLALATVQQKLDREPKQVQQQFEHALQESRALADEFDVPLYQADVSRALEMYGNFVGVQGDLKRNKQLMQESLAIRESLHYDFPDNGEFHALLANAHYNLGVVLDKLDEDVEAEAEYLFSKNLFEELMGEKSSVRIFGADYTNSLNNLTVLYLEQKRTSNANLLIQESLPILAQMRQLNSAFLLDVGRLQLLVGEQFLVEENLKQAEAYLTASVESLKAFLQDRENENADILLASALMGRAEVFGQTGRVSEGKQDWQEALAHAPKVTLLELQWKRASWLLRYAKQNDKDDQ